ncbi:penicillin-binding protein 1C [Advenella sp. RU8]|uniref:penicillin-binding protein 1C n=1 Tax=Advenella sp. RU8 TaxID=3399575 RepID=UPI003AAF71F0
MKEGRRWLRILGLFAMTIVVVMALAFFMMRFLVARQEIPAFEKVRDGYRSSYVSLLDRQGHLLQQQRQDFQARRGEWTSIADISPAMLDALLVSEDKRFYAHHGVDALALLGAAYKRLIEGHSGGASTLTMQLAGLLDERLFRQKRTRSYRQKVRQIIMAQALEQHWSKYQILEAYLNLVPFRGELTGISSASRALLQKYPAGINHREAAMLAALLRAPNASVQTVTLRACGILRRQAFDQDCAYLERFVAHYLANQQQSLLNDPSLAPHYASHLLERYKQSGQEIPADITSTLNRDLQRYALQSIRRNLKPLQKHNANDAAVIVLDNRSGQILAYIGSSADLASAVHVDHVRALRQAGSTLKPFLYAQAIDQRRLTGASLLDDSPVNLDTGSGLYVPQNYDRQYSGWASVRVALASSLNIPAVRALTMVTPDAFQHLLSGLGLPLEQSGDYYGYSLALGSAEVSLLSLTNAYRALANGGVYTEVNWALPGTENTSLTSGKPLVTAPTAWIIGDMLSDRQARARTFGLDSALSTPFWSAVKTGTSKDMRDNWTIGWSQDYTVGVWVGNSSGASMYDITGVSGAGPIWHDVIGYLHQNRPSLAPRMPAGVVAKQVVFDQDLEPTRTEYFLPGTELSQVSLATSLQSGQVQPLLISHPADATIIALDPDIPVDNQRLMLRAGNPAGRVTQTVNWYMNGQFLGNVNPYAWLPMPGRHRLEIRDEQNRVIDAVVIQVRGARLAK